MITKHTSPFEHIQVKELHPTFGAEISGVDFSVPVTQEIFCDILAAVTQVSYPLFCASHVHVSNLSYQYGVVVFRNTSLTDDSHVAFARQFGELDDVRPYVKAGRPNRLKHDELFDVSNVEMDGSLLNPDSPRGQANKGNGLFHVDSSFNPRRAGYSLLLAHELPPRGAGTGGQTAFADTRTAFDELPTDIKESLVSNDYVAAHSIHHSRKLAAPEFFADLNPLDHPMGRHNLVQRHEASARMNLYIAAHIHHIEGLSETESAELLQTLFTHATQDKYVMEVQWENPGDLVIWDNTCTMHRAVGGPFLRKYRRDMRRATVHDKSSYAWGLNEHTDERQALP